MSQENIENFKTEIKKIEDKIAELTAEYETKREEAANSGKSKLEQIESEHGKKVKALESELTAKKETRKTY